MMTPEELGSNISFSVAMRGYSKEEVDNYIDNLLDEYRNLYAQNADYKKKLEVLASKIEEYRKEEDNIRNALVSAQKLGDSILRESRHKADITMQDANIKAQKVVENAQKAITREQTALIKLQQEVANFKTRLKSIYMEHLSLINALPGEEEPKAPAREEGEKEAPEKKPEEKAAPAQPAVKEDMPEEKPSVPESREEKPENGFVIKFDQNDEDEKSAGQDDFAEHSSKFGKLKFGDDYDLSADDEDEEDNQSHLGLFKRKK